MGQHHDQRRDDLALAGCRIDERAQPAEVDLNRLAGRPLRHA